jgi:hypothetical protein
MLERPKRLQHRTRIAAVPLRRHRKWFVECSSAVRARHLELREEPRRLAIGKHPQELDDSGRASYLPRLGSFRRRAARVEPRDGALRQCARASSGYRIGEASIRTMFAGSW